MEQIIECVPNFSEGKNQETLLLIKKAICSIPQIKLLHIDSGVSANRTVFTFAGAPKAVIDAAFLAIKVASENIDMTKHTGTHPRIGACDVCPLIPISGITMQEVIKLSEKLAERVCNELSIPVYLYEKSAKNETKKSLENIRKGEFENLYSKLTDKNWIADYLPLNPNIKAGATVIGARNFLIAYNINLNTKDVEVAKKIAAEFRELRKKETEFMPNLSAVKAIGWYIPEFKKCQISTNITDYNISPITIVFDTIKLLAIKYNVKVTGSELIGLIPENAILNDINIMHQQKNSKSESINQFVKHLNLNEISVFEQKNRVLEYVLNS